jgi:hypothetical protein
MSPRHGRSFGGVFLLAKGYKMSKETFYFQHDYNAIADPNMMLLLSKCGLSGVGLYWILVEMLHQQPDSKISYDSYKGYIKLYTAYEHNGEQVLNKLEQELINCKLLVKDGDFILSERVLKNKKTREIISLKRSEAGKKSGESRRLITSVEQVFKPVLNKGQQGKERKGKEIYSSEFLKFYSSYPRKIAKEEAWKAWKKANGNMPPIDDLLLKINEQKKMENWTKDDGKYIPHPATWINQKRWEDEGVKLEAKASW